MDLVPTPGKARSREARVGRSFSFTIDLAPIDTFQEIFFRCAFGDDSEARATASVADQSLRLDPGELCGDLRRLQLQVCRSSRATLPYARVKRRPRGLEEMAAESVLVEV